ncbi:MAG: xanthine dehydrogenase family protein molybdopterin-binding subunit [Gemmobacter sp.]
MIRADAAAKVAGTARYTVDAAAPGMLHAKLLRSGRVHARVIAVDAAAARAVPGVHAVLTAFDLAPVPMPVYGYYIKDQPILTDHVRYRGDPVAAVAAETEAAALAALRLIRVTYADLPAVPDIAAALAPDAPALFPEAPFGIVPAYGAGAAGRLRPVPNVCFDFTYTRGAPDAFAACDHVWEDRFSFPRMTHAHLEPFVCLARWHADGLLEIETSNQNPFPLRRELGRIFGIPETRIAVRVPFVGGGFGAKNNCKTEPLAALLAQVTGRPVRLCLTMEEGFLTNTQHAATIRLRTGAMADGTLVARSAEVLLDAGAYADGSPLVAERAAYRAAGPYRWAHVQAAAACVMTNTAPAGPFRGFGGTQVTWAGESQIDMIARRLGRDPLDLRRQNLLAPGEAYAPGDTPLDSDVAAVMDLVADAMGRSRAPGRGLGLAIGFKDGGGVNKPAQARVKANAAGDVWLACGSVEMGQGAQTAMAAVVAGVLGCDPGRVTVAPIDTRHTPFDQGTNASSGVAVMGRAVQAAAEGLRDQVLEFAAARLGLPASDLVLVDWAVAHGNERRPLAPMILRHFGGTGFEFTAEGFWKQPNDPAAPMGSPCPFWEVSVAGAEVSVDEGTGRVTVHRLIVASDAGHALAPDVVRGQDEGGALMGLGQALFERMLWDGGTLVNIDPLRYRMPMAEDLPADFRSLAHAQGLGPGPGGAKGVGEGAILPVAAAIANAIDDAAGVRITALPLSPDRVLAALAARGAVDD